MAIGAAQEPRVQAVDSPSPSCFWRPSVSLVASRWSRVDVGGGVCKLFKLRIACVLAKTRTKSPERSPARRLALAVKSKSPSIEQQNLVEEASPR